MVDIQDIKLPPNSQEAEKWVISSIILDNDSLYSATSYFINAEDFYQKEHQFIYKAISQLWESNKTIDVITISVPNIYHKDLVIKSLEAKKHVYCDKPLATSTEEAEEIVKKEKESRVGGRGREVKYPHHAFLFLW